MNDFDAVAHIVGLIALVGGAAVAIRASWVLVTGRRPWRARRLHSLAEPHARLLALSIQLTGFGAMAIGGPYVVGSPVRGAGLLLQAAGFALMAAAASCWAVLLIRSDYGTP